MPAPYPPEFRRRAVDLARQPGASVARVAKDLGISESGLRRWLNQDDNQDDIDTGPTQGPSTSPAGRPSTGGAVRTTSTDLDLGPAVAPGLAERYGTTVVAVLVTALVTWWLTRRGCH